MTGCCDICERCAELYPFGIKGNILYLCPKCLYELRTEGERYPDDFETLDGTLDSSEPGGVRDGR